VACAQGEPEERPAPAARAAVPNDTQYSPLCDTQTAPSSSNLYNMVSSATVGVQSHPALHKLRNSPRGPCAQPSSETASQQSHTDGCACFVAVLARACHWRRGIEAKLCVWAARVTATALLACACGQRLGLELLPCRGGTDIAASDARKSHTSHLWYTRHISQMTSMQSYSAANAIWRKSTGRAMRTAQCVSVTHPTSQPLQLHGFRAEAGSDDAHGIACALT